MAFPELQGVQMECDIITRTGPGLKDWWQTLTNYAVAHKYDSWAVPWLAILRGPLELSMLAVTLLHVMMPDCVNC